MLNIIRGVRHVLDTVNQRLGFPVAFIAPAADVVHDHCCEGQLAARVVRIAPRVPPGGPGRPSPPVPMGQVSGWVVTVGVQHVRCVETVDDLGNPPAPVLIDGDGEAVLNDAATVLAALACDLDVAYRPRVGGWTPIGPSGGCAGGEWEVQIEFGP